MLDHISHSQVEMFLKCPRQWQYRYVEGLKIPPSGALVEGSCYHSALEGNFRQKVASMEDLPIEHCEALFSDAWSRRLAEEESIAWEGSDPGQVKDEGVGLVREYMESTSPSVQPSIVEEPRVSEVAGVKFVCVPDLEDVARIVVDHKTSAKSYTQDEVDRSLQASAAALVLDRPIIYQNHVAVKTKAPRIQIVKTYRLREDIDWYIDMVVGVLSQMKIGTYPPRPTGWWCSPKYCGYHERCRGELARSYSVPATPKRSSNLTPTPARTVSWAEAARERLKEAHG